MGSSKLTNSVYFLLTPTRASTLTMDLQTGLCLFGVLFAAVWFWLKTRLELLSTFRRMGLPGPTPSFFCTNIKEAWADKKPWLAIDKWSKRYGKVFGCFPMGIRPILVVSDREMLKEILITNFSNFRNRPALGPPRSEPGSSTLTSLRGERWKRVRNVISPTFSTKKVRQTSGSMNKAAGTFVDMLNIKAATKKPFDIYQMFQALTLDVIAQAAFALKVDSQTDPDDALLGVCRNIFKSILTPALKLLLLFPEIGPAAKYMHSKTGSAGNEFFVITHMRNVFHERRRRPSLKGNDMIQLMLDATDHIKVTSITVDHNGSQPGENTAPIVQTKDLAKQRTLRYLTENELVANCFVFLLAGYETTANALAFTVHLLAKHQNVQDQLYRSIIDEVGLKEEPEFEANSPGCTIPYLDAVIKESLRIYPPITGFVMRECLETCEIKGIQIPAGMAIHIPVWTLHHDPELWTDPETFVPERFLSPHANDIPDMAYLAFGEGPRNCIGMSFAMMEIRITLVRMLRIFRLKLPVTHTDDLELESPFVTMNPKYGVTVELERRTGQI